MRPKEPTGEKKKRRTIGLSTVAVILVLAISASMISGWAVAGLVNDTGVTQSGALYSISSEAAQAFPNPPSAQIASVPSGVSGCTGATIGYPANTVQGGTTNVYFSAGAPCSGGSFSELLEFSSPATINGATVVLTVYTSLGNGTVTYSPTTTINVNNGIPENPSFLWVYVIYGALPPVNGINGLEVVLT